MKRSVVSARSCRSTRRSAGTETQEEPTASSRGKKAKMASGSREEFIPAPLAFEKLIKLLNSRHVYIPSIWKKILDPEARTVLLCQVDSRSSPPKFLKSLRIQWQTESSPAIPGLFVEQQEVSSAIVQSILSGKDISDVGDVVKLLNYLLACSLTSTTTVPGDQGNSNPSCVIENIACLLELNSQAGGASFDDHQSDTSDEEDSGNCRKAEKISERTVSVRMTRSANQKSENFQKNQTLNEEIVDDRPILERPHADLRGFYWTTSAEDRTPLFPNGGIYIQTETLSKLREDHPPTIDGEANYYGWHLLHHMLGGNEAIRDSRRKTGIHCGLTRLLGNNVLKTVREHVAEIFRDSGFDAISFKAYIASRFTCLVKRAEVKQSGALMASLLYDPTQLLPRLSDDVIPPPYYRSPAPGRTCLSEKHAVYVNTFNLAELQRYFGPESSCGAGGIVDYSWRILRRLCGGETRFNQTIIRQRDRLKARGGVMEIVGEDLMTALYEHANALHSSNLRNLGTIYTFAYCHIKNRMDRVVKNHDDGIGPTAWRTRGEAEPPVVALLQQQKYWLKPGPDRTQLRPGHEIHIETAVLEELEEFHSPRNLATQASIKIFSWELIKHMLGGMEIIKKLNNLKIFPFAVGSYLDEETMLAICLYADGVFHLQQSIHPKFLVKFCNARVRTVRYRPRRNTNRRNRTKAKRGLLTE